MQQSKPRWKRFKFKVGFAKRVVDFVAGAHRLRREQHVWRDLQVVCSQHGAVEDGSAGELGRQNTGQEGNVATFCLSLSNSTYFFKGHVFYVFCLFLFFTNADCRLDLGRDGDDRYLSAWLPFGAATQGEAQLYHELRSSISQIPWIERLILCVCQICRVLGTFPIWMLMFQQLLKTLPLIRLFQRVVLRVL